MEGVRERWRTDWTDAPPVRNDPPEAQSTSNCLGAFETDADDEQSSAPENRTDHDPENFELCPPPYCPPDPDEDSGSQIINSGKFDNDTPHKRMSAGERLQLQIVRTAALIMRCLRALKPKNPRKSTVSAPEADTAEDHDGQYPSYDTVAADLGYDS